MKVIIIAAVAKNRVIGRTTGGMPWHSKEEFQHFKNTTLGFPVIMGRRTFDSIQKPLKGRLNIVLTNQKNLQYEFEEVKVFNDLTEALIFCASRNYEKSFIIGGGFIFPKAMEKADEMIISVMNFEAEGDVYFPEIKSDDWKIESTEKRSDFEIIHYIRK